MDRDSNVHKGRYEKRVNFFPSFFLNLPLNSYCWWLSFDSLLRMKKYMDGVQPVTSMQKKIVKDVSFLILVFSVSFQLQAIVAKELVMVVKSWNNLIYVVLLIVMKQVWTQRRTMLKLPQTLDGDFVPQIAEVRFNMFWLNSLTILNWTLLW